MAPITPSKRLQLLQNETLEAIARGEPLVAIMEALCLGAEAISPGAVCSVVSVTPEQRLKTLAAPSLPVEYCAGLDGIPVGPTTGSCGAAMVRGEPVTVLDIETDPLWAEFRAPALALGLLACWSSPIRARDGSVIGSFAFYFRAKRGPAARERRTVATCAHLCAIAMEHERVQSHNHRLAYCDTLTGLPNRAHFNEAYERATTAPAQDFGLMLIDIDNLKTVNDGMGHDVGDALIAAVGRRLQAVVGDGLACRIGGDEFAVLLPGCSGSTPLRAVALAILNAMSLPLDHGGHAIIPSVTIGGVLAGADGADAATLRQNADFALYHAKETRRGGYVRFKDGLRTSMTRRIQILRHVDEALAGGRIFAHYQPVVEIGSGAIVGLEALARMRMSDGRVVTAGDFQEALRDPKVAYRITTQMLASMAGDLAAWNLSGLTPQIGLNVTSADFQKGDLCQRIARALDKVQLSPEHLVVEITEQVFMGGRRQAVARTIQTLRERGIRVSLDDFGTGFASLTHLLDFPVDIIKIDKAFVTGVEQQARSSVIIESLITIASRLGMTIIAEGIETEAQADRLRAMGCRYGQGFLYSPAVPACVTTQLLARFGRRRPATVAAVTATAA